MLMIFFLVPTSSLNAVGRICLDDLARGGARVRHRHVPGCGDFPQTCQWWLDNLSSKWVGELLAEAMEKAMEKLPGTCGAGEVSGQPPNYEAARLCHS